MPLSPKPIGDSDCGILRRYAALAAGGVAAAVATFESSEAALVFTTPNLVLDPEIDPIMGRIDLNGDGLAEVGVTVVSADLADPKGNNGLVTGGGLFGACVALAGRYPIAFQASDFISASLSFRTAIGILAWSAAGPLGARGDWLGGGDGYLGARFEMDGTHYFGWVHAVWDPAFNTMTFDLAAYEDSGGPAKIIAQPEEPQNFALSLGSVFDPAGGRIEWVWPVLAGKTYELQRAETLDDWHTVYTVTPTIDGEATYLDDEFTSAPKDRCFYRVKQSDGDDGSEASLLLLALGIPRRRPGGEQRAS